MKRVALVLTILLGAALAQAQQAVPEIPFDSVPNFFKLPADLNFGEDAGVAVNSKGHVFVYTRSNSATGAAYGGAASQLLEFDQTGKFVREIGKGLYAWAFAHVVRVDKDDNIWAVDKGSDMVIKFNPEGHVVMVFGRKKEASDDEAEPWKRNLSPPLPPINGNFRQPTDVAWNAAGDIFISDGYVNSRVAKYDKNGDWVKSFGEPGSGPGQLEHAAQHRDRRAGQRLRGQPRQRPHRGVRRRRQVPAADQARRARCRPTRGRRSATRRRRTRLPAR